MITQHPNKSVQRSLAEDFTFIVESLEKLVLGTCCSDKDGGTCTWELLPKIHEALSEHISFEKKWLFPKLSLEDRLIHKSEHDSLLDLLAKASWELECAYGDQFKSIAANLLAKLHEHHAHDPSLELTQTLTSGEECCLDRDLDKIKRRVLAPQAEPKAS